MNKHLLTVKRSAHKNAKHLQFHKIRVFPFLQITEFKLGSIKLSKLCSADDKAKVELKTDQRV
jgi:hypothetical protein